MSKECEWEQDELIEYYETDCGRTFELIDGTPEDNNFKFCAYCGGTIKVKYCAEVTE